MATLRRLRDLPRQPARAVWEDEDDSEPTEKGKTITYDDTKKVKRRAGLLADRQAAYAGVSHMKKDELARITPALQGVDLAMVKTEHWADEVAADLHADMPWMGPATEYAWHARRRAARRGEAIRIRPVILNGPPGIGKSVWTRKLARLLAVPTADIDASKGGAGFTLCGLDRGWGGITAPSVAEVMRSVSSRAPSIRCAGASEDTIQLSTTEPTVEPMNPPMAAPEKPRIAPPKAPPMAVPTAPRTSVAMENSQRWGKRKAKAMRRRHVGVTGSSMTPRRS